MPKLTFKEDFSRLSFADLSAIYAYSFESYEACTLDKKDEQATFYYKVCRTTNREMERRIIEKFTLKTV